MRTLHYNIYLCLLALMWSGNAYCEDAVKRVASDTLEVKFRVGQSDIDLSYANNQRDIASFAEMVKRNYANSSKEKLQLNIYSGASPEGPTELNRRLGEQRGLALKKVLDEQLGGFVEHVTVINQGARWGGLAKMVEQSNEPWKYEVLSVLAQQPAEDEWKMDPREVKLRKLRKGTVWQELNEKYMPDLRSSGSAVILELTEQQLRDTLVIRDTVIYLPEPCLPYIEPADTRRVWAVKTNLLMWGVVAPNIQVERSLGKTNHWSIEGEFFWPWWTWSHNAHAEQFMNFGLELRYWLGNRNQHHNLDGWHIGLGCAIGYYDWEWKRSEGYQGEYLNAYVNLGYQHRFGKRKQWAVDGGLALGYIPTKYRHYLGSSRFPVGHEEEYDDHLMWQDTGWKHFIGATHVNFTIAYMFGAKKNEQVKGYSVVEPEPVIRERQRRITAEQQAQAQYIADSIAATTNGRALRAVDANADSKAAKAAKKQAEADAKAAKKQAKADAKAAKKAAEAAKKQADAEAKAVKEAAKKAKSTSQVEPKAVKPAKVQPAKVETAKVKPAKVKAAKVQTAKVKTQKVKASKVNNETAMAEAKAAKAIAEAEAKAAKAAKNK